MTRAKVAKTMFIFIMMVILLTMWALVMSVANMGRQRYHDAANATATYGAEQFHAQLTAVGRP